MLVVALAVAVAVGTCMTVDARVAVHTSYASSSSGYAWTTPVYQLLGPAVPAQDLAPAPIYQSQDCCISAPAANTGHIVP